MSGVGGHSNGWRKATTEVSLLTPLGQRHRSYTKGGPYHPGIPVIDCIRSKRTREIACNPKSGGEARVLIRLTKQFAGHPLLLSPQGRDGYPKT